MTTTNAAEWWGQQTRTTNRHSLLQFIQNNTIDLRLAALLWTLVEQKASIIIAAAPQLAGKTTLLTALIDFIPPWYERVYVGGQDEDFSSLKEADPQKTYILAPELSDHTEAYLWGDAVVALFKALDSGHSMASTMHADSPEEVVATLEGKPLKIPAALVANVYAIANLRVAQGRRAPTRRVNQLTLVAADPQAQSVKLVTIAGWDPDTDTFLHMDSQATVGALAERLRMDADDLDEDLLQRRWRLERWLKGGPVRVGDVRQLVAKHYEDIQAE